MSAALPTVVGAFCTNMTCMDKRGGMFKQMKQELGKGFAKASQKRAACCNLRCDDDNGKQDGDEDDEVVLPATEAHLASLKVSRQALAPHQTARCEHSREKKKLCQQHQETQAASNCPVLEAFPTSVGFLDLRPSHH